MASEINACPWCHSINVIGDSRLQGVNTRTWKPIVVCRDCGACGPWRDTLAEAIAAWNQRPSDAVLEAGPDVPDDLCAMQGSMPVFVWVAIRSALARAGTGPACAEALADMDRCRGMKRVQVHSGESSEHGKDGNGDQIRNVTKEVSSEPKGEK